MGSNLLYVHADVVKQSLGPIRKNNGGVFGSQLNLYYPAYVWLWSESQKFPVARGPSVGPPGRLQAPHDWDQQLKGGGGQGVSIG